MVQKGVKMIGYYLRIWWRFTQGATQLAFVSRFGASVFIIGKILRFVFFLFFIVLLFSKTKSLGGYNLWQMVLFFLTFNILDTLPQFLLRDVYRFRSQIINGYFDYTLMKPMSPLFKSLFGGCDAFDFIILIVMSIATGFIIPHVGHISLGNVILYICLILNGFIIALAFHIGVISMGILTTEVDSAIFLYRDITQMGKFPVDIYKEPFRAFLTFILPIGIMMTFPAQALLGLLSVQSIFLAFFIALLLLLLSIILWRHALKYYASASS